MPSNSAPFKDHRIRFWRAKRKAYRRQSHIEDVAPRHTGRESFGILRRRTERNFHSRSVSDREAYVRGVHVGRHGRNVVQITGVLFGGQTLFLLGESGFPCRQRTTRCRRDAMRLTPLVASRPARGVNSNRGRAPCRPTPDNGSARCQANTPSQSNMQQVIISVLLFSRTEADRSGLQGFHQPAEPDHRPCVGIEQVLLTPNSSITRGIWRINSMNEDAVPPSSSGSGAGSADKPLLKSLVWTTPPHPRKHFFAVFRKFLGRILARTQRSEKHREQQQNSPAYIIGIGEVVGPNDSKMVEVFEF